MTPSELEKLRESAQDKALGAAEQIARMASWNPGWRLLAKSAKGKLREALELLERIEGEEE